MRYSFANAFAHCDNVCDLENAFNIKVFLGVYYVANEALSSLTWFPWKMTHTVKRTYCTHISYSDQLSYVIVQKHLIIWISYSSVFYHDINTCSLFHLIWTNIIFFIFFSIGKQWWKDRRHRQFCQISVYMSLRTALVNFLAYIKASSDLKLQFRCNLQSYSNLCE